VCSSDLKELASNMVQAFTVRAKEVYSAR